MILGLFLLGLNNSATEKDSVKKPVPVNTSFMASNAIPVSVIKVQFLQKTWIVNNDSYKLLAFNINPLTTSKRTELKISHINKVRQSFLKLPQEVFMYHSSPPEADDFHS
jgi:hypothetical protein